MILGLTLALTLGETVAQTPYGWRGPTRSGQYPETGLLKQWPANGPQLLWETLDAGKGYSSPVIVDDRIYLTGMNEDETKEIFSAYSMDGKKIYEVVYGNPWDQTYPETRTTPAIDNGKAYVISGSGEIVCINTGILSAVNADIITGVSMMLLFVFAGQALADFSGWLNTTAWAESANLWFDFGFDMGFLTLLIAHVTFDIPYVIVAVLLISYLIYTGGQAGA